MKIIEFILQETAPDLAYLKQGIKKKIDKTDDVVLLNRIASSLESTNIKDRIKRAISSEKDRDIGSYFDEIVRVIIDTDGTVEDGIHLKVQHIATEGDWIIKGLKTVDPTESFCYNSSIVSNKELTNEI